MDFGEAVIKVETNELKEAATRAGRSLNDFQSILQSCKRQISSNESRWRGRAATRAEEELQLIVSEAERALKELGQYPADLLQYAGVYDVVIVETIGRAKSIADTNTFSI